MKKQNVLMAALLMTVLASCSSDDNTDFLSDPQTVKFTSQISNQELTNTRASATTWDADDAIGVFMVAYGETLSADNALANNKHYVTESGGVSGNFIPATAAEVIHFPADGSSVDFLAYYPYQSSLSNFIYPVDITTQVPQAAIDLLYSNTTRQMTATATNVGLKFKHQLSKITLAVSSASIDDLSGLTVSIKGVNTKANFDLVTGELTVDNASSGNVSVIVGAAGTTGEAILIPDADVESHTFVFSLPQDDKTLVWEETISRVYVANKKYPYTVVLNKDASGEASTIEVSLGDSEIEDWDEAPAEDIVPGGTEGEGDNPGEQGGGASSNEIPEGYSVVTLAAGDNLETSLAALSGKVAVVLPQGGSYDLSSASPVKLPASITGVAILGEAGDNLPLITTKGLSFEEGAAVELIKFHNIHFKDAAEQANYVLNVNTSIACTNIIIKECLVEDVRGTLRIQAAGVSVSNIDIEDCVFNNIGSYGIVSCQLATATIGSVSFKESTVNGIASGRGFDFNNMTGVTLSVESCTFYKAPGADFVRVTSNTDATVTVNNTIFGGFYDTAVKGCNKSGCVTAENTYYTTGSVWTSNGFGTAYAGSATDLFVDPANADFRIKDSSFATDCGDPRWK